VFEIYQMNSQNLTNFDLETILIMTINAIKFVQRFDIVEMSLSSGIL